MDWWDIYALSNLEGVLAQRGPLILVVREEVQHHPLDQPPFFCDPVAYYLEARKRDSSTTFELGTSILRRESSEVHYLGLSNHQATLRTLRFLLSELKRAGINFLPDLSAAPSIPREVLAEKEVLYSN